ncbi:MAG: hypothetical protein AB1591_04080 [Pseudomonadota bacterium]
MSIKTVSAEQLKRIENAMKNAPKIDGPLSVGDAIRKLSGGIKSMRAKGHSWQQIADVLRMEGITISAETLRRYVTPKSTAKRTAGGGGSA